MRSIVFILSVGILLSACSGKPTQIPAETEEGLPPRPLNATNYQQDLIYPRETEYFVAVDELTEFADPWYGAAISYLDKRDYPDIITVFIYPIPATSWTNQEQIFDSEIDTFLLELESTVNVGAYQSVDSQTSSDYLIENNDNTYKGKKIHYEFTNKQGLGFNSDVYLFLQKDKVIKIRTSSRKDFTPDWNGDLIANELLPEFVVPGESEYMRIIREEHRRATN